MGQPVGHSSYSQLNQWPFLPCTPNSGPRQTAIGFQFDSRDCNIDLFERSEQVRLIARASLFVKVWEGFFWGEEIYNFRATTLRYDISRRRDEGKFDWVCTFEVCLPRFDTRLGYTRIIFQWLFIRNFIRFKVFRVCLRFVCQGLGKFVFVEIYNFRAISGFIRFGKRRYSRRSLKFQMIPLPECLIIGSNVWRFLLWKK